MIQARSADGVIHQFPDGTDPAAMDRAMKAYAQQSKPQGPMAQVTGFMANVNRGLGIGDEMAAGARTAGNLFSGKIGLTDLPSDFNASMAHQRELEGGYQAQHPHMAALARGTGMAATAAVPAGNTANVFAQGARVGNMARGATQAGLTAAGYAAVDAGTPRERLRAASSAATNPFVLGLGAAGGALATPGKSRGVSLSRDELETAKNGAYRQVDDSGVAYTPEAFKGLTRNMANAMDEQGFHAGLHPKANAMMERIGASDRGVGGYSPTLSQLDQLRQQVGRDVSSAHDAGDARMGQIMRGQIDKFINTAGPEDLAAAANTTPQEAADLINTARGLNTRLAKVDAINDATGLADRRAARTGSGGNIDNTIRQNMDKLLSAVPNWTEEERTALDNIVMGGKGQNLLRLVGKLSPSGNGLHLLLNIGAAGAGGAVGGPGGAAAAATPAVAGILAKLSADGMTRSKVARLVEQLSTLPGSTAPGVAAMSGPAAAGLSRAAGVGGAVAGNPFARSSQPTSP